MFNVLASTKKALLISNLLDDTKIIELSDLLIHKLSFLQSNVKIIRNCHISNEIINFLDGLDNNDIAFIHFSGYGKLVRLRKINSENELHCSWINSNGTKTTNIDLNSILNSYSKNVTFFIQTDTNDSSEFMRKSRAKNKIYYVCFSMLILYWKYLFKSYHFTNLLFDNIRDEIVKFCGIHGIQTDFTVQEF
jgi:hypothetical protein